MKTRAFFLAAVLACQHAPEPSPSRAFDPQGEDLNAELGALAADSMEGRGIGTKGIELAADYIAARFRAAGLQPQFQTFTVSIGAHAGPGTKLAFNGAALEAVPFSFSDDGQVKAGAVFAGYGISAPELGYDDYAGITDAVKGKIAVVFEHEPREQDAQSPFRRPEAARYRELRYKAMNARDHGAAALLVVPDAAAHPGRVSPPPALSGGARSASAGILAAGADLAAARALLGDPEAAQRAIDEALKPASRELQGDLELAVELVRETATTKNVVAIAPGKDLAQEAVVIGAHYDHLGYGGESSLAPDSHEVHNGADDNASGTSALFELARRLAGKTRRTLVFIAFSGEEMGLLGSAHYVKNPLFPLDKTVAMLNLDMIGRMRDHRVIVHGVDTGEGFRDGVGRAAATLGLTIGYGGDGYGPSDHTSFYAAGKPVLFFFTGAHADYHRPTDDADKIDFAGLAQVVGLVEAIARGIADSDTAPALVKAPSPVNPHGAGGPGGPGRGAGGGYGPYLGTIPDFAERTEPGVLLSGVRPGSPAGKAGLRAGDVLVKLGEMEIRNLQEMTYALRAHRAGETVELTFLRGAERITVKATLEERR